MAANSLQVDWRFWRNWGLAFLGFPFGGLAALGVAGGIETAWDGVGGGLAGGAVIGGVQWLALRPYLHLSPIWIVATSVGMGAGLALSTALLGIDTTGNALLMRGALTGLSISAAQWLVLRQHGSRAGMWIPTVALAWALGWAVTRAAGVDLAPNFATFGSTGAWAFQLVTGLVLVWLLGPRSRVGLHLVHR
jgi:hypothetical protein